MKPLHAVVAMAALLVILISGLLMQRCDYQHRFAQQQATSQHADAELVTATQELATEHVVAAKAEARATVRAAVTQAQREVSHAEGDSDLAAYLDAAVSGAGAGD